MLYFGLKLLLVRINDLCNKSVILCLCYIVYTDTVSIGILRMVN